MCALTVGHEHHATLMPHVDALARLAADLDLPHTAGLVDRLAAEHRFVVDQLVPHMERVERTVYPELERLMEDARSMAPLRREHEELRRLVGEMGGAVGRELTLGERMRLRRVLYRMYGLLKVHLSEEEGYLRLLDRSRSEAEEAEFRRAMEHATTERV